MRIEIEIPKEFEEHFEQDKFEDTLHRLNADAHLLAGNYEKETVIMLIKAFKESKPAYDVDSDVEQLKEISEVYCKEYNQREGSLYLQDAIDIVRNAGKGTDVTTNNDFCEWEDTESLRAKGIHYGSDGLYKPSCNGDEDDFRDWNWIRHFKFCPYCGKKIKVVE